MSSDFFSVICFWGFPKDWKELHQHFVTQFDGVGFPSRLVGAKQHLIQRENMPQLSDPGPFTACLCVSGTCTVAHIQLSRLFPFLISGRTAEFNLDGFDP